MIGPGLFSSFISFHLPLCELLWMFKHLSSSHRLCSAWGRLEREIVAGGLAVDDMDMWTLFEMSPLETDLFLLLFFTPPKILLTKALVVTWSSCYTTTHRNHTWSFCKRCWRHRSGSRARVDLSDQASRSGWCRNTASSFRNTASSCRNTASSFRNTVSSFRNTASLFRNTLAHSETPLAQIYRLIELHHHRTPRLRPQESDRLHVYVPKRSLRS